MITLLLALSTAQLQSAVLPPKTLDMVFEETEARYGIPRGLVKSICFVESSLKINTVRRHDGKGHSFGICQVKLNTARQMGFVGTSKDLMNPVTNIDVSARYLLYQLNRYEGNYAKAITAYNQGTAYSHGGSKYLALVLNRWVRSNKELFSGRSIRRVSQ